jgi:hypothetical protein
VRTHIILRIHHLFHWEHVDPELFGTRLCPNFEGCLAHRVNVVAVEVDKLGCREAIKRAADVALEIFVFDLAVSDVAAN